jgi:hypothetical protein
LVLLATLGGYAASNFWLHMLAMLSGYAGKE